jgi:hypothetical protein
MLRIGNAIAIPEETPNGFALTLIYPSLPRIDHSSLRDATLDDFERVRHLRFDPVSACNRRCAFCHSDFSGRVTQLIPQLFSEGISFPMSRFENLAVGCAYEPPMGKFFQQYPSLMAHLRDQSIRARIITNGLVLHKKDISPWVEFGLEYIHVSAHSHIPDVYEPAIHRRTSLKQLTENLRNARLGHPSLRTQMVNVICKENYGNLGDCCRWAFDEVGATGPPSRTAACEGIRPRTVSRNFRVLPEVAENGHDSHHQGQSDTRPRAYRSLPNVRGSIGNGAGLC